MVLSKSDHDQAPGSQSTSPCSAAIVGSGPVGMVLALKLASMGIRSILIEQDTQTLWHPKGNTHNARTMEHYRSLGLAAELRSLGLPPNFPTDVVYLTGMNGVEIYRHTMPSSAEKIALRDRHDPLDQQPEPLSRVNQMYVERVVSDRVRAEPLIESCYGWRLDRFEDEGDGVSLFIVETGTGRSRTIKTRYLAACDGPRSLIRQGLGIRYVGEDSLAKSFMGGPMVATYVRIRSRDGRPVKPSAAWQYWLLLPDKIVNLVTLDGEDDYIFTAPNVGIGEDDRIRSMVIEALGFDAEVQVLSTREWTAGRALVAERYRSGNVFICGDSAHLFTPTGGFGMNTGIDDAVNLAWKLAGAIAGWAGPQLLDTYETERRPIAVRNSTRARGHAQNINEIPLGTALGEDSEEGHVLRTRSAAVLATLKEEFGSIGIQLGARYDGSPIVAQEPGEQPPEDDHAVYLPTSLPGGRAPHVWLPDGTSLFDHFGPGFTVLRFDGTAEVAALVSLAQRRCLPLKVVDISMPIARTLYPYALALIRPDQNIAWRGNVIEDASQLLDLVTGTNSAHCAKQSEISALMGEM